MGSVMADDEALPMDDYAPKGVHIWETEMHDFVVLYVVKGNAVVGRGAWAGDSKCSVWNFPIRDNRAGRVLLLLFLLSSSMHGAA